MKVSIIIPVYNSEKYLEDCLHSVLNQTYDNIEVICVDDGSTDDSLNILLKYKSIDSRIMIIEQENSGPNKARYNGLKRATGDYVLFVDSDDTIVKDCVSTLVKHAKKGNYDVIHFEQLNGYDYCSNKEYGTFNKEKIYNGFLSSKRFNSLCRMLYKRSLLGDGHVLNNNLVYGEDMLANLELLTNAESVLMIPDVLYNIRINNNSTTRSRSIVRATKNIEDFIVVYQELYNYLDKWDRNDRYHLNLLSNTILDYTRVMIYNLLRTDEITKSTFLKIMEKYMDTDFYKKVINNCELKFFMDKPLTYRLKNYGVIVSLLKQDYDYIWSKRLLLKIKDIIK